MGLGTRRFYYLWHKAGMCDLSGTCLFHRVLPGSWGEGGYNREVGIGARESGADGWEW